MESWFCYSDRRDPMRRRRKRVPYRKPPLSIAAILAWADEYHQRLGRWPVARSSGAIRGQAELTWTAVDMALSKGNRGLPGGTTLAKLLAKHRGHRHHFMTPRLSVRRILAWADAHKARTGAWPNAHSGPVREAPGETWSGVGAALRVASRGIKQKTSLARLLAKYRGRRHYRECPRLTAGMILQWAKAWRVLYGTWPSTHSGTIGNTGETWLRIDAALRTGGRGLPGGSSLSRLIKEHLQAPA